MMADLARIKRNVRKMVDMNAPEADIDAYIEEEGVSLEAVRNFREGDPQPDQAAPSPQLAAGLAELSRVTQNPAQGQYEALPAWQKPIVAASDVVQLIGDGLTYGMGDRAVAAVRAPFTDKSYDEELAAARARTQGARQRAGNAGLVAEALGAIVAPFGMARRGATLVGRFGTTGMTGAKGVAARTGLMAAEGTAYGAANAAGHGEDLRTGALVGALGGAGGNLLGEGISAGVRKAAGLFNPKAPPRMTEEDLLANAAKNYKEVQDAGIIFKNEAIKKLRRNVVNDMADAAYHPGNEPGAKAALSELNRLAKNQSVTLKGLDTVRRMAANGYIQGNSSNNAVITKIINRIDEMFDAADPATTIAAKDPVRAAELIKKARALWHSARKLETVEGLLKNGEVIGGSQKNQDVAGATGRQLRTLLTNKTRGRGFTPAEKMAAEKAVLGTRAQRILHAASGMVPTGRLSSLAQGSLAAVNMATGNLPGLALQGVGMAVGYGAGKAAQALARKSVEEFVDIVARGGAPAPVVENALQLLAKSKREAIARALMAAGIVWQQQPRN